MSDYDKLKNAFGSADKAFVEAVDSALAEIRKTEEETVVKNKIRISLVFAILIVLLLAAAAFAATRLGVLDFIVGRYAEDIQVLPSATEIIQENVTESSAHTQFADFSVRQAVFDGNGVYIAVAAKPADEHTLLLGTDSGPEMPVSDFGPRFAEDEKTIAEYAKEIKAERMAYTGMGATEKSDISFETLDYMLEDDGTLVYMMSGVYEGTKDNINIDLVCLTYAAAEDESTPLNDMDKANITFTLKSSGCIGEAVSAESADYKDCGVRVDEVRLKATSMAVYATVYFSVTDKEKFAKTDGGLWFEFVDGNGKELAGGATAGGSVSPLDESETRFIQKGSISAMEELPESIFLRAYNCWEKNRYETREITLKK